MALGSWLTHSVEFFANLVLGTSPREIAEGAWQGAPGHKNHCCVYQLRRSKRKGRHKSVARKKKKDMPIKKLLLKIWRAPSPLQWVLSVKKTRLISLLPCLYLISN